MRTRWSCAAAVLSLSAGGVDATVVRGRVVDAASGEALALATVQVVGRYRGTIANEDGDYAVDAGDLPARLRVTRIGYATLEQEAADPVLDFALRASPQALPVTVVVPDEARRIMAEVIARKQVWRPRLRSWRAEGYARQVLSNDAGIAGIAEAVSRVYWDRERGTREVILSKRSTRNVAGGHDGSWYAPAATDGFVDLYDDDVPFIGQRLIGPTHPEALEHYDFELLGRRLVDDRVVFDIGLRPKSRLQAAFEGRLAVVDGEFALLEAELRPSRGVLATAAPVAVVEDFAWVFAQQFRPFDGVWLPVDLRSEGRIRVGVVGLHVPNVGFRALTRLSAYEVDVDLPPALYAGERSVTTDSASVRADTAFALGEGRVPLSARERAAYAAIDSTKSLAEAFRPTGFLARFADTDDAPEPADGPAVPPGATGRWNQDWRPRQFDPDAEWRLRANRVEGACGSLRLDQKLGRRAHVVVGGGVDSGARRPSAQAGFGAFWMRRDRRLALEAAFAMGAVPRIPSALYPDLVPSLQFALGLDDYHDYYWRKAVVLEGSLTPLWRGTARAGLRAEEHEALEATTQLPYGDAMRANPAVPEGDLRALWLEASWGEALPPLGVTESRRLVLAAEYADDRFGSDWSYSTWRLEWDWHEATFWRRRWMPNALDLRLVAGTSTGRVPLQRHGALDVGVGPLTPFGAFRGAWGHPYEGPRYGALFWEHTFRSVPFEYLGLWGLARRAMGLAVHGAAGRTWSDGATPPGLRASGGWHHELGASLVLYGLVRVDGVRRLDRGGWRAGASLARFDFD